MKNTSDLCQALKTFVEQDGRSLYELANLTGISKTILGRFMRGERSMTLPTAAKLCEVLGVELRKTRKEK
jgi:transcriptional regulator with XRE-family HTH domain